jgi:hypothetical protein
MSRIRPGWTGARTISRFYARGGANVKTESVVVAARNVLNILDEYQGPKVKKNERAIDAVFLAYLRGCGLKVARQHHIWMYGTSKPQRIDYRVAGNPRSVIELAVRPPQGRYELDADSNHTELKKLARVTQGDAHMRYLVLLDLSTKYAPIDRATLEADYGGLNAGRGKFTRNPVRVIYAHAAGGEYHFPWSPWA